MPETDLTARFCRPDIAEDELLEFLSWGWDGQTTEDGAYNYGGVLKTTFSKKHRIQKIVGDPDMALVSNKLKELEEVFSSKEHDVFQRIIFLRTPIKGFFRYNNVFQVLPEMGVSHELWHEMHPTILQLRYNSTLNDGVNFLRQRKVFFEILHILNVLLKFGVEIQSDRRSWAIVPKKNLWGRKVGYKNLNVQLSYFPKDFEKYATDEHGFFSSQSLNSLSTINDKEFTSQFSIGVDEETKIPDFCDKFLDGYFNLSKSNKSRFLRASFWLRQSSAQFENSISSAFLCLVQGIETVMEKDERYLGDCDRNDCSHKIKIGDGPTACFKKFIDAYAGGVSNKLKDRLYSIRSKIVHGDRLLLADFPSPKFWSQDHEESMDFALMRHLVVVCLVNWVVSISRQENA